MRTSAFTAHGSLIFTGALALVASMLEIHVFAVATIFVCIGFSLIGTGTFRLTLEVANAPSIAAWLAATGLAALPFLFLCTGCISHERAQA